ncbi:MAG: transporter substrate-binding domain-containing protein [Chloroflexota bacterium]|nr:transporter substrate-binding domain-containing protein [Chloroflexota bacterium]
MPANTPQHEHRRVMKRAALSAIVSLCLAASVAVTAGSALKPIEQGAPIPTLVAPTLVPAQSEPAGAGVPTESGVARILRDGKVRVGMLYNEPPFGVFNIRGEESGFDADLARAIGEAWGVPVEFQQVTRQTAIEMTENGAIDLLIGAQPHTRTLDSRVEFSQSYYPAEQVLLVREGDGATVLEHMADRQVGVIVGTRGESAVADWRARASYPFNVQQFFTLDEAFGALDASTIDAIVENRVRLAARLSPGKHRFVDVPVTPEPYAIAVRRQDVNLRGLVDRTLQYLYLNGKLDEIHQRHFNGEGYPGGGFVIWDNVGTEAPRLDQVGGDVPLPGTPILPRLLADRNLRIAGLRTLAADAPESERRLDAVNRALVNAIAARWSVNVVPVPEDGRHPTELVAAGAADLAVGVDPDWARVGQVDYTSHYLIHGYRLMVRTADNIGGFGDLRGKIIGIFQQDSQARDIVGVAAQREGAIIDDFFTVLREQDAGYTLIVENNATVMFGDSLRQIANIETYPDQLKLTTDAAGQPLWYTRDFIGMAAPRNDLDFRLLVEYTLQDLYREGALRDLLRPLMLADETPQIELWPGRGQAEGALAAG